MINKRAIALVVGLLWLRWLTATLPGYIHPDEFFQNPEITASNIFNIQSFTPWEYSPEHASRSIIAPFLTTGIPFWILKYWLTENRIPSSITLFTVERLGAFVWSLLIDVCVYRLCKRSGSSKPLIPMILVATSQVTLAYYTRPFSNSFETSAKMAFLLGTLFSLGVFTRITFPLYAFPIGIAFIYQAYTKNVSFSKFIGSIISLVLGMASFAMFCITADSVYYGTLSFTADGQPFESVSHVLTTLFDPTALITIRPFGNIVVTPLNNLIYNMNTENLALHGIHPRYTHFAINLPLLYGPLFIFGFLYIPNALVKIRNDTNAHLFYVLLSVVLTGVIGLSIMPHQEARFLCPLLVPLVLIYTWKQPRLPSSFWTIWLLFNVITAYIFSVVHQGGLVPAMGFLQRQTTGLHDCRVLNTGDLTCIAGTTNAETSNYNGFNITTNLVFYKTYMPPRHLLAFSNDNKDNHVNVLDFSSRLEQVVEELEKRPGVILRRHETGKPEIDFAKTAESNVFERTIFIVPSYIPLPKIRNHRYLLMATYSPHVSFDDMDKMIERASETNSPESQMRLNIFLLLSDKDDIANH